MNARVSLTARKVKWIGPLLALMLLAGVAWAAELVRFPQDQPFPFYALGLGHSGLAPEDWVVTAFCYPPDSFKANYDLFNQPVDPSRLPEEPGYLEGFGIVGEGPYPLQVVVGNVPGVKVPIWFTSVSTWNDKWTVSEMEKQGSLRGSADFFQQIQQPIDPSDPKGWQHSDTVASGVLDDGRSFYVHSEVVFMYGDVKDAQYNVTVRFGK